VNSNGTSAWSLASPRARTKPPLRPAAVALGLRAEEALAITLTLPPRSHTQPSRSCFHHSLWVTAAFKTASFVRDPTGLLRRRRFFMGPTKFLRSAH
jgi:hypothetical protein